MTERQKKNLAAMGGRVTDIGEMFGLTPEQVAMIEMLNDLSFIVRDKMKAAGITQRKMASMLGSSASRVNLMLQGHESVGLGLYVRALLVLGASREDIGKAMGGVPAAPVKVTAKKARKKVVAA